MDEHRYREAERDLWTSVGATPTERFLDLDRTGARVRVLELGDGPPVLLLHGGSNAGSSWAHLAPRLAGFRTLLLDRPGCGLSPRLGASFRDPERYGRYAEDLVVDVLDALDLPRAHLIGTSFGGLFTLRAAAAHPERFARLVLLGWSAGAPLLATPLSMRIATTPVMGKLSMAVPPTKGMVKAVLKQIGLRGALESGRFGPTEIRWFQSLLRDTDTMRNELEAAPQIVTMRGLNDGLLLRDELLERITSPALFLWGTDDPMGGEPIAKHFVSRIPGAQLEMVANAGHAPWIDEPDTIAHRISAFLDER